MKDYSKKRVKKYLYSNWDIINKSFIDCFDTLISENSLRNLNDYNFYVHSLKSSVFNSLPIFMLTLSKATYWDETAISIYWDCCVFNDLLSNKETDRFALFDFIIDIIHENAHNFIQSLNIKNTSNFHILWGKYMGYAHLISLKQVYSN